jgi:hypothetical protein
MTRDWKSAVSRRPVLSGILAACGIAVVGGVAYEAPRWSRRRYKPSPFDDLLANLPDRQNAARVGAAVIAETPGFNADRTARELGKSLAAATLADALSADLSQNRMIEVRGWILPKTLADLCALAAKAT